MHTASFKGPVNGLWLIFLYPPKKLIDSYSVDRDDHICQILQRCMPCRLSISKNDPVPVFLAIPIPLVSAVWRKLAHGQCYTPLSSWIGSFPNYQRLGPAVMQFQSCSLHFYFSVFCWARDSVRNGIVRTKACETKKRLTTLPQGEKCSLLSDSCPRR